jgi:DNA-binding NarL/FixJ family response regulator
METSQIRILIVDDHPLIREGLTAVLQMQRDMEIVGEAADGKRAIQLHCALRPDVTLMDLRLPDISGIEAILSIRAESPVANIIILTTFEGDFEARRALQAGARGYLLKSMPPKDLADAIRNVHSGKRSIAPDIAGSFAENTNMESMSERETAVLAQIANGLGNREIGEQLSISEETVKAHIKHILDKLYARDRTEAVTIAIRRGIIQI